MDILNWLYLAKNKFVRTTLDSTKDLMIFGAKVGANKRGDIYQNYAMSAEDFLAQAKPYKVYSALLTQNGTNPPVVTILENTLGANVDWYYQSTGAYYAESFGTFISGKTTVTSGLLPDIASALITTSATLPDQIFVYTRKLDLTAVDGVLNDTLIEIKVYN